MKSQSESPPWPQLASLFCLNLLLREQLVHLVLLQGLACLRSRLLAARIG